MEKGNSKISLQQWPSYRCSWRFRRHIHNSDLTTPLPDNLFLFLLSQVIAASHVSSPLHLKLLLDELRVVGRHDTLSTQAHTLLKPKTVVALFACVLQRLENAYNSLATAREWPTAGAAPSVPGGLVGRFMVYLVLSRHGLTEHELLSALGVSRAHVTPLLHAVAEVTQTHSGLVCFSHDAFALSVQSR